MKRNFTNYLKEMCCLFSDQHFSFKCFQKDAFVREIFPKSSGLLAALSVNGLSYITIELKVILELIENGL